MALKFPPQGTPAWFRMADQLAAQHDVDLKRLWHNIPQVPDPQAGLPFTGPASPSLFYVPTFPSSTSSA